VKIADVLNMSNSSFVVIKRWILFVNELSGGSYLKEGYENKNIKIKR
jgi:hypothetical protein